ncbi:MAG: ferredoxin reductase [Polyangiales bacterium]
MSYPREPEAYLALLAPARFGPLLGEVIAIHPHFAGCATILVRVDRRFAQHRAGQFVAVTIEVDGVRRTRCFSISSAPRADGDRSLIELTIKAKPGGTVTPRLVDPSIVGATVELSQPMGSFVLDEPLAPRLLFVTGGSGITPVLSMLRAIDRRAIREGGPRSKITLLHFARSEAEALFIDELREMPWLDLRLVTDEASGRAPSLDEASLAEVVDDFERTRAYACGPAPLLAAVERAFEARGAREALTIERFAFGDEARGESSATVRFVRSNKSATSDRTLLVVAEEQGLEPKSGCRMGICGTCHCKKLSGTTRDLRTGEVSTESNVDVALCSTVAVGDVAIDL